MRRLLVVSLTVIGVVTVFAAAAQATDVALFFNPTYVDTTSPPPDADAQNFKQALELDGFTVTTFTGITAADINAAVTGKQVLAFPELEVRDLSPDLDANALFVIANFVSNDGGTLIVCNQGDGDPLAIINKAFVGAGFVMTATPVTGPITITSAADGTSFAGGPATLPVNNATNAVLASSVPPSAKIIYADANGNGVVVLIPPSGGVTGGGNIVILGWDWFGAASAGGNEPDTDWDAVLKVAASITGTATIPTLSEWALIVMAALLVLFGFRGLRRRVAA
jgi:exosortase sorting signal-containing protein